MTLNIYIESSIQSSHKTNGVVCIILADETNKNTKTIFGSVNDVSANKANLIAIKQALSRMNSCCDMVLIHTTSWFVKTNLTEYRANQWIERDFKNTKGEDISFKDEWMQIFKSLEGRKYEVHLNEPNEFRKWMQEEVKRRAKRYV